MNNEEKYISRFQAAKFCGISNKSFYYLITQEPFNKYLIKDDNKNILVNIDVIQLIKNFHETHSASFNYYNSNPNGYIPAKIVAQMLNISYQQLIKEICSSKWENFYVKVPKFSPPKEKLPDIKFNYFFIREKLLQGKYNTINSIAKKTKFITETQIRNYIKKGLLPQPEHLKNTNLYDENQILHLLPSIKLQTKEEFAKKTGEGIITAFELLDQDQQKTISKYINFRDKGGVIHYNGYSSKHNIANKEETLKVIKRKISSALILIISGRCGIEEDFHKNPLYKKKMPESFNPDVLDILSVRVEDYFFISAMRKGNTLIGYYRELKPFYYYLLDELEEDSLDDSNDFRIFSKQKRNIEKFLNQFPQNEHDLKESEINHKSKTFLTREQMVLIKQLILEDFRSKNPIKYATMWQLSCSTGIRPEEQHKLEINHFQLDSNGYINSDNDGWGLLSIPAEIAKQESSPSHPIFHTPIPKDTVKQINQYLSILYKRQGENTLRGKGYLFRPDDAFPFYRYKNPITFKFINRLRSRLDFIDEEGRQDFIFKASRHSLNNSIMRTYISSDQSLNGLIKQTAADHQLRHKPAKSVGEEYYLADISKEEYYKVLDATINFPWDTERLREWEEKMGYRLQETLYEDNTLKNEDYDEKTRFPLLNSIDDDLLLTPKNIANLIGVHEETVRRWCRKGYLKCISPFGRFKIRGLDFKTFAFQWYRNKNLEIL